MLDQHNSLELFWKLEENKTLVAYAKKNQSKWENRKEDGEIAESRNL